VKTEIPLSSVPEYLLNRDPEGYSIAWKDRRLRRLVLVTGIPTILSGLLFGAIYFVVLAWFAGGFRCPRCRQRFAGQRLSFLLRATCKVCSLRAGSRRDLTEAPMFPRLIRDPGGRD
jgi:hypothetical protein